MIVFNQTNKTQLNQISLIVCFLFTNLSKHLKYALIVNQRTAP